MALAGVVKDPVTGVEFPSQQQLWAGGLLTSLGAGARIKKLGFVPVKVYAVTMYVDAEPCTLAIQQERRPDSEAAALDVLQNGAFAKALQIHLVRGVSGKQFVEALDEHLRPIMRGDEAVLDQFCAFFQGKQLDKGTRVALLWRPEGPLDVALQPPSSKAPLSDVRPGLTVASPRMGHALWELYLSPKAPSPEARKAWLAAVPALALQAAEG